MDTNLLLGGLFLLLGAICGGSFGLPSKYAKDTPWENLWGPFFLFATILLPVTLGPMLVKDFYSIYSTIGIVGLIMPLIFGFLWGMGSMTLGMSFAFIGLSLAYALNYGAQIIFGSIAPMLLHHRADFGTTHGNVIMLGVAVCVLGVIVSGRAGILKTRSMKKSGAEPPEPETGTKKPKMLIGLIIAVLSGLLCACYALAASYAGNVGTAAAEASNPPWASAVAVTAIILWGGAFSACIYCAVQLTRKGLWKNFGNPGTGFVLLLALVMAFLHDGAIFLFGLGFPYLGDLGVPVGYPAFMSFAIIVGNVHGFRTGEWKGASARSIRWILAGIVILIIGVAILGRGNAIKQTPKPEETATAPGRTAIVLDAD